MRRQDTGSARKLGWVLAALGLAVIGFLVLRNSSSDEPATVATTTTAAAVASTASTSTSAASTTTAEVTRRSLPDAVQQGLVEAEFQALGGASGDIVELDIRRLVDVELEITVPAGLMLQNPAGDEQDLVIAGLEGLMTGSSTYEVRTVIRLNTDELWTYLLKAYCAEAHDANPSEGGALTMGETAGSDLVAVLETVEEEGVGSNTALVQALVWVITDDVSLGDLDAVGYGFGEGQMEVARNLIEAAGLDPEDYRLFSG